MSWLDEPIVPGDLTLRDMIAAYANEYCGMVDDAIRDYEAGVEALFERAKVEGCCGANR